MNIQNRLYSTILLLIFAFAQVFWAQSNWDIEQLSNRSGVDMDVGTDGVVHIVYEETTYSGKGKKRVSEDHVYYNTKTDGVWGIPLELGLEGLEERRPSLDVDAAGVAHVVFDMGGLQYWNSANPSILVGLDYSPYTRHSYIDADIAVGSEGTVHVVLSCNPISECCGGNVFYTSGDGNSFSPIVNIESPDGNYIDNRLSHNADIEIDDANNIGIVYRTVFQTDPPEDATFAVSYISKIDGVFSEPEILAFGGNEDATNYSIIFNNGYAYILYGLGNASYTCSCQGRYDIFLDKFDPADGISETGYPKVVANASSGASLDYNSTANKLHLAYVGYYNAGSGKKENWKGEIRYLQLNTDGLPVPSVESISDGYDPHIVVNADGTDNITFMNNGNLFYGTNVNNPPPPPPPASGEMHVINVIMSTEKKGARWNAVADVLVVDAEDLAVSGALVTGNWSGLVHSTNSATTDAEGMATIKSGKTKKNGTITFTVTDIFKDGWTYDRSVNVVESGSISSPLGKQIAGNYESAIPDYYALFKNYPNPFNPTTHIRYALPEDSHVILKVYDVLGNLVLDAVSGYESAGYHEFTFDASKLSSGLYLYSIIANDFIETKKMLLMK